MTIDIHIDDVNPNWEKETPPVRPFEEWMTPEELEAAHIVLGKLPLPNGKTYTDYHNILAPAFASSRGVVQ